MFSSIVHWSHCAVRVCPRGVFGLLLLAAAATSCTSERSASPTVARLGQSLTLAEAQALCAPYPDTHLILGTDGDDVLDGTNKSDCIVAGPGHDRVQAGNGNDIVYAGSGDDEVRGGNGDDLLVLGGGNDRGYGGNGNDELRGESGADTLDGENGNDLLGAGTGNDRLIGGNGNDTLRGEDGADVFDGQNGTDSIFGDDCHDRVVASAGGDSVSGGGGIDVCAGPQCELASGSPTCFLDANCVAGEVCVTASGVCVAAGTQSCALEVLPEPDAGTCTPSGSIDSSCNGVDDDCDGEFDENYAPEPLACGVGACVRTQVTSCINGDVIGTCVPGAPAANDASCDAVDDDCDGSSDESFIGVTTHCGIGACATEGVTDCVAGVIQDRCEPGAAAATDGTCDGADEDCDGAVDEDVTAQSIACGVGACSANGTRACIDGALVDSCTPGTATLSDNVCNGIDDDCDARTDEDYVVLATSCGIGSCAAVGQATCVAGILHNSCQPANAAPSDSTCNAADDDCDSATDEDAVPVDVICGVGACARSGNIQCVAGQQHNTCTPGEPLAQDASCNAVDDDCDGRTDENYVSQVVSCGAGACAASGTTSCNEGQETVSCTPGTAGSLDDVCNGLDDDCNGQVDEDYAPQQSSCGIGACASSGLLQCVSGALVDDCQPRAPLESDDTCNGQDDDCDGATDEDYEAAASSCGLGACQRGGSVVCASGSAVDTCVPGTPGTNDASCNEQDDDCDGDLDEDYAPVQVACGVGACSAIGSTACVDGQVASSCVAGLGNPSDQVCNGIDDDCDERIDEDAVPEASVCGIGGCAAAGVRTCVNGIWIDACQPGGPATADGACDGVDEDCDGTVDEEYQSLATYCGVGVCAASGATTCVDGEVVDSCVAHPPAANDDSCNARDDDCDGTNDEGYNGGTTLCGIGACRAMGQTICVNGILADTCMPGPAGLEDATCNGIDDDCGGIEDEDYQSVPSQCGVGVCQRSGSLECVAGQVQDTCQAGTGAGNDGLCDGSDDDCDGRFDEDYISLPTQCGVGACTATGSTSCIAGSTIDSCVNGQPGALDFVCDGRDDDCDGTADEDYTPQMMQCGVGACIAAGSIACVGGALTEVCSPMAPTSTVDSGCDGVDEDCDGSVDEDYAVTATTCGTGACLGQGDLRCVAGAVVDTCQLRPNCEASCHDGTDDDQDGRVDCRDSDCDGECEIYCADGADDEGDGDLDCADADCVGQTGCVAEICGNSLDDDGDGFVDCADLADCSGAAACPGVPPAATSVAPPLNPNDADRLLDRVRFLFEGGDPIQRGVAPGTIEEEKVSVITGGVRLSDNRPLPGVQIRVSGRPEFGLTHTDEQGQFYLIVNGGELFTLDYIMPGYISAQRQLTVRWQNSETLEDVVLIPRSPVVSTIDVSGTSTEYQVGVARAESDSDGARRAVIVFPPGIAGQVFDSSGGLVNVPSLDLRLTEMTVGPNGRAAMPAELPPSTGYTYAIEIAPDEANGARVHGHDTILSAPVSFYVDNFLSFPTGTPIPTGYYDEQDAAWKPIDSGLVIDVVGETAGIAEIDTTGDGVAEDSAVLASHSITEGERRVIASQYNTGASLWRVRLPHFSVYDMNMGAGPDGNEPPPQPPDDDTNTQEGPPDEPHNPGCDTSGAPNSVVDCFSQVLQEEVPVAGTPYTLHYRTDRVPGRLTSRHVTIPVRTPSLDAKLAFGPGGTCLFWSDGYPPGEHPPVSVGTSSVCYERSPTHVLVDITPAGQKTVRQRWRSESAPAQITYTWGGKDDFGRPMRGQVPVTIQLGYEYGCEYTGPARFGEYGGARVDGIGTRTSSPRDDCSVRLVRDGVQTMEYLDYREQGLGGWSLDVNHRVTADNEVLYGDGSRGDVYDPATQTLLVQPHDAVQSPAEFAMDGKGTIYIATDQGVYRQLLGGNKELVAQRATSCNANPDQARLCGPTSLAVARNGDLYVADHEWVHSLTRIMRINPDGTMRRVAGGPIGYSPEGGPALSVRFTKINDIEVADDGTLYVLDGATRTVHRIGTDGIVQRIAGNGATVGAFIGEADDARTVPLLFQGYPSALFSEGGIAIDTARGGIIIVESGHTACSIRHVSSTGRLTTIQRHELCQGLGPTLEFTDAVVDPEGQLILAGGIWHGVYRMERSGPTPLVERLAGLNDQPSNIQFPPSCSAAGFYPTRRQLGQVRGVAIGPDGYIYFAQACFGEMRVSRTTRPAGRLRRVVSEDAREVFEFDLNGRHQRTLSQLTGAELRRFEYDADGRLTAVVEADGNQTTLEYDANGKPTAIVAPFGQRTNLEVDENDNLSRVQAEPDHAPYQFDYEATGLMVGQTDPRGSLHSYEYDALGRVSRDQDPGGGGFTFSVINSSRAVKVTRTSALGQVSTYDWRNNPDGTSRYTITFPTGRSNVRNIGVDGTATTTMVDGTTIWTQLRHDPTFGMAAPLSTVTITAPNALIRTLTQTRTSTIGSDGSTTMTESLNDTGRTSTRSFVPASRTWTLTTAEGRTSRMVWDALARVVSSQGAGTLPTTLRYDARGRVDRIAQSSDRFIDFAFDPSSGYLLSSTDAIAQTTSFGTDSLGRVTNVTGADQSQTTYEYDGESNLTSLTPPERPEHQLGYSPVDLLDDYAAPSVGTAVTRTRTTYDLDRRPAVITQPDGLQQTFSYHPTTGLLTSSFVPGMGTTTYEYDTRDRMSAATRPGGGTITFEHSGQLLWTQTISAPHILTNGATTVWTGPLPGYILFEYDTAFNVKSVDVRGLDGWPRGFAAQYARDRDDLITSIAPLEAGTAVPTMSISRSPLDGHVTGTSLGIITSEHTMDTSVTTPGYGDLTRLIARVSGTNVLSLQYQHDALGRIRRVDEVIQGTPSARQYEYDAVGRLTRVRDGADAVVSEYEYDGNGARTRVQTSTEQLELGVNLGCGQDLAQPVDAQDRLCRYGDYAYAYNANGQLASKTHLSTSSTTQYTYDGVGRLKSVVDPMRRIDYAHDPLGRRVGRVVNGTLDKGWVYGQGLGPVAQLNSASQIEATFVYGTRVNVPEYMVVRTTGQVFRLITDHLGSVRLVVNAANGSVVQRIDYDEFGNVLTNTNPGFQPFGFAGGLYEADTGLARFGARDYDAVSGMWTAKDPSLFSGGDRNLYRYAAGDPINLADVNGKDVCIHQSSKSYHHRWLSFDNDPDRSYGAWPSGSPWWSNWEMQHPDDRSDEQDDPTTTTICVPTSDAEDAELEDWIEAQYDFNDPSNNPPYVFLFNDCRDFVNEAVDELARRRNPLYDWTQ